MPCGIRDTRGRPDAPLGHAWEPEACRAKRRVSDTGRLVNGVFRFGEMHHSGESSKARRGQAPVCTGNRQQLKYLCCVGVRPCMGHRKHDGRVAAWPPSPGGTPGCGVLHTAHMETGPPTVVFAVLELLLRWHAGLRQYTVTRVMWCKVRYAGYGHGPCLTGPTQKPARCTGGVELC